MSNKINIEAILCKRIKIFSSKGSIADETIRRNVKAAIKEIVEAVIDKCANEANVDYFLEGGVDGQGYDCIHNVDKDSILDVKNHIDYGTN